MLAKIIAVTLATLLGLCVAEGGEPAPSGSPPSGWRVVAPGKGGDKIAVPPTTAPPDGAPALAAPPNASLPASPAPAAGPAPAGPTAAAITPPGSAPTSLAPTGTTPPAAATPPATTTAPTRLTRVSPGNGQLPNDGGQVWREYDISPYTRQVTGSDKPEQAIVDWILRETGTEAWFGHPLGILSAEKNTLKVYHTPAMQEAVLDVVERFIRSQAKPQTIGIRLVTVENPNWRALTFRALRPVNVQSPGVQAWLITKEDAALLLDSLRKRSDYREHNAPNLVINNGQSETLVRKRPRSYTKGILLKQEWPFHDIEMGQVEEGFALQISPLVAADSRTIDAVIKCHVDQVEQIVPVWLDVPTPNNANGRVQIQVPQMTSWRLHERFRWPSDMVLLLSAGVVAVPDAGKTTAMTLPNLFDSGPARADALLFLESKGVPKLPPGVVGAPDPARTGALPYSGRY